MLPRGTVLSVVIPTYRKLARLRLTLTSLLRQCRGVGAEVEVIVVDDGGGDNVVALVERAAADCEDTRVRVAKALHRGRSAARNLGASLAAHQRVLFLDDDVLLAPGVVETHLKLAQGRSLHFTRGTILNLPWLVGFDDPEQGTLTEHARRSLGLARGATASGLRARTVALDECGSIDAQLRVRARMSRFEKDLHAWLAAHSGDGPGRWIAATGAQLSVYRPAFDALGGFDETMGLRWGAEDLELGYRAEKAGIKILHEVESIVFHMDHDVYGRDGDHEAAFTYFADKHGDACLLKFLSYFSGRCSLLEAFAG